MKKSAKSALREKNAEALQALANEARETLFKGRMAAATQGKGLGIKQRSVRRQIARIETLLTEKAKAK